MAEHQSNPVKSKKLNLNITTPRGLKFALKADMIIMRCVDGDLGVLPGHEPVSTVLGDGVLRIINNGVERKLAVFGGVAEISPTTVNILTTIAQRPDEIDRERAERDRRAVEAALEESEERQIDSLRVMLRRSLVRIEVSTDMEQGRYFEVGVEENDEES